MESYVTIIVLGVFILGIAIIWYAVVPIIRPQAGSTFKSKGQRGKIKFICDFGTCTIESQKLISKHDDPVSFWNLNVRDEQDLVHTIPKIPLPEGVKPLRQGLPGETWIDLKLLGGDTAKLLDSLKRENKQHKYFEAELTKHKARKDAEIRKMRDMLDDSYQRGKKAGESAHKFS